MSLNKYISVISFSVLLMCSCKKDELPVPAHDPGNVITAAVDMEANYKWQFYYDLKTNTVVGQNIKTVWDLGFETSPDGFRVILNTSKAMFAKNAGSSGFSLITDTIGFAATKKWDEASGNPDSTAIGDWRTTNNTYIIDRGFNETGVHQGFRKIQFQSVDAEKYMVRFANMNGTGETVLQINKDSIYNFTFLSFTTNNVLIVEPPKASWDLVFTQYTHIFYDGEVTPYLVTGCLLNRYNTKTKMDSTTSFITIGFSDIENYTLSESINTIGYTWKEFTGGIYVTLSQMNYIIKDNEGFYYKLHFIDFYNTSGVKGNPKWEYQQL
jgi:heme-binding HmuY-like protein